MSPDDVARRRDAKRFNERIKLFATFYSNSGVALLVGGGILPYFQDPEKVTLRNAIAPVIAVSLHLVAQCVLTLFKSED